MRSRAVSALVFGFCFGLIFMLISLFTPPVAKESCGGKTSYEIFGFSIKGDGGCTGGTSTETVGLPFASREKYSASSINYEGLGLENPSYDFKYRPAGIIGNLIAYWILGFIFFFIFARSRNSNRPRKNRQ